MNPWNEFVASHAGMGYTMSELSDMYRNRLPNPIDFAQTIEDHATLYPQSTDHNKEPLMQMKVRPRQVVLPAGMVKKTTGFTLGSTLFNRRKKKQQENQKSEGIKIDQTQIPK